MRRALFCVAAIFCSAANARAGDPVTLKLATIAPEGSPWARELVNFARQVQSATGGEVRVKWYFNAVAGDDVEQLKRMERGQLDGVASGAMGCERLAPTLRVSHLPGVFQDRDEANAVLTGLRPLIDQEAHAAGYSVLSVVPLGPSVFYTRTPVRTFADLKRVRLWRWSLDEVGISAARAMGLNVVPTPVEDAARAFDEHRIDALLGIPAAALAFQWSAQARYFIDLRVDYLFGCMLIPDRVLMRLSVAHQAALRDTAARVTVRYDDLGRRIDDSLVGGLFQKQGMASLPISDAFRAEFFAAARVARGKMAEQFVSRDLLNRVQGMLADYRAEHGQAAAR